MADVDSQQQALVFQVAVIGSVGQRFLELLNAQNGELELGAVAGYHPRFVFTVFPDDPWAGEAEAGTALEQLAPQLDALVLTDDFTTGCHYVGSAIEKLSKVLSPVKVHVPTGIFGGPALEQEWASLSGTPVVAQIDPKSEDAKSVLKGLTKALLRSRLGSTPPPPSIR
jgi:hypothetical protein